MVRPFLEHLGGRYIYSCGNCQTYLSRQEEVISRSFRGASGRAFLFRKVVNVMEGPLQDRMMVTGRHFARDVSCKVCKTVLGWKYEFAYTRGQEYKEGNVVLEEMLMMFWEEKNALLWDSSERASSPSGRSVTATSDTDSTQSSS